MILALTTLVGCTSSSGGGSGAKAVVASAPIHLDPGQTTATLAWAESDGVVDSYIVFESRNGGTFTFSAITQTATVDVTGAPGDSVQISVVATSPNGQTSDSSAPSPPLIFHAAEESVAAVTALSPGTTTTTTTTDASSTSDSTPETEEITEAAAPTEELAAAESDDPTAETTGDEVAEDETTTSSRLVQALRALLLGGDARLPESGLSDRAEDWLQNQVDHEIAAGVSLAGTGRADSDETRDVIWQDQAGQLFVSDGGDFVDASDLPATFDEALRLGVTERFVGLADFDGDGLGDWLLEDTATGDVWVVSGTANEQIVSSMTESDADADDRDTRLAGHGDFDGDGLAELLWVTAENRLEITRDGTLDASSASPAGFELLAIADLDGDGHDDVLGRNATGGLSMAMVRQTDDVLSIEWRTGTTQPTDTLDLIATLDVDDDGSAEIAWLNGDALEIWSAEEGLESAYDL